jgi:hypothetical protein
MMRLRETRGDQLVPNTLRKRYIYKIVTVNVTDLSSPEAILRAAEAVRVSLNSEFEESSSCSSSSSSSRIPIVSPSD